jgi:type I restriction enzyme S subunit
MKESKIPPGWEKVTIGNFLKLKNGYAFQSSDYTEAGIPLIRISDIQDGKVDSRNAICVPDEKFNPDFVIKKGDILVAMSGATTGKYGVYTEENIALQNQRVGKLVSIVEGVIPNNFIYYTLSCLKVEIEKRAYGAAQPNISPKLVEEIEFVLPPANEQTRIANKLDDVFSHLDILKNKVDNLPNLIKKLRENIVFYAVKGKLTSEWRKKNAKVETGLEFTRRVINEINKDRVKNKLEFKSIEPIFEIPESWCFSNLQNFGEVTRGKSKHRPRNDSRLFGGNYPFIQTGDVSKSNGLITEYKNTYSEFGLKQSRLFPKGTLCITIAANIAETGILDFDACFPDSVVGYIPFKNYYSSKFAMYYFQTIQKELEKYAPATAQKNINLNTIFEIAFPIPPQKEQEEIVKKVQELFVVADDIEKAYNKLKTQIDNLPKSTLDKAFRGDLVPQDERDEPAIKLLERIKNAKEVQVVKSTKAKKIAKRNPILAKNIDDTTTTSIKVMINLINEIKTNFGSNEFTYEELAGKLNLNTKAQYIETKKQLFELLRNQKLKSGNSKLNTEIDTVRNSLKFKLSEK